MTDLKKMKQNIFVFFFKLKIGGFKKCLYSIVNYFEPLKLGKRFFGAADLRYYLLLRITLYSHPYLLGFKKVTDTRSWPDVLMLHKWHFFSERDVCYL